MEENKEKYIQNSVEPVSIKSTEIILNQMKNCVCKIHIGGTKGTGFFTKIPYKNDLLTVLITNNHVLGEENLKDGKIINISLNNEETYKNIKIDSNRKRYTNEILDISIIEIKGNLDNINDFLILDNQILDKYNLGPEEDTINCLSEIYENESIYLLNYIDGREIFTSYGLLHSITESIINHKCNTDTGSSGSPILLLKSNKVIGIHYGCAKYKSFNFGSLILKPIFEFQQISNNMLVIKKNNDSNNILYKNNNEFNEIIINKEKKINKDLLDTKKVNELIQKSVTRKFNEIQNNVYDLFELKKEIKIEPKKQLDEKYKKYFEKNENIINKEQNSNEDLLDIKKINELIQKSITIKFNEIQNNIYDLFEQKTEIKIDKNKKAKKDKKEDKKINENIKKFEDNLNKILNNMNEKNQENL